jgi:AAA15 family ATPase/GTPase
MGTCPLPDPASMRYSVRKSQERIMIVEFSVSNFRSFLEEQTFSLVASKRLGEAHLNHLVPIPNVDESVLKLSALYGANGAGKSNLFRALRFVRNFALQPNKKNQGTKRESYHTLGANIPSNFDLQFIANEMLYRCGFMLDDTKIIEEWLYEVIGNRTRTIYERVTKEDGKVQIQLGEAAESNNKIAALASIGGPQNQTFLATINATLEPEDIGEELSVVLNWFMWKLQLISPDEIYGALGQELSQDTSFLEFASSFLRASGTGVDNLDTQKKEVSEDDLKNMVSERTLSRIQGDTDETGSKVHVVRFAKGKTMFIECTSENRYFVVTIHATHKSHNNTSFQLDLNEESDGTRRLLDFIPALHQAQKQSAVYFIDEIDRSMHPMLAWKVLDFFANSCVNVPCQMIVTTHESTLLDLDLLRRDEIWFAEKDRHLETKIYPLTEFQVRNDIQLRKNYLKGRFGAIPFLGDFSKLESAECQ